MEKMMIIKFVLCLTWILTVLNTIIIGKLETKIEAIIAVLKLVTEKEKRE